MRSRCRSTSTRSCTPGTATSSRRRTRPGSLPQWGKWIDKAQVKKLGFKYNIAGAKALLAANGYRDTNGDGFVENKDGSQINLRIIVPNGWSDWMTAIQIIADSTKAAGIKLTPAFPDFNALVEERNSGKFDLVINNEKALRQHAVHLLRLPLPPADRRPADVRQLLALHSGGLEAVGADGQDEQDQVDRRGGGEAGPLADPDGTSSSSCPRFRSGTTACGRSTTRPSGPTSRAPRARGCRTRHRRGTATST